VQTKSALSTYASTDTTSGVLHPIVQRIADPIKAKVTEPFWRGLKDGTIEARNRERTQSEGKTLTTGEKKRALVFAGLVSRPTVLIPNMVLILGAGIVSASTVIANRRIPSPVGAGIRGIVDAV
jgi:hypothetical protein